MTTSIESDALLELTTKARNGCQESLGLLCEHFQDEVGRYIYRLTLDQNLTDDIRQEALLQMCQSLKDLRDVNHIKAWLFKTAWSKAMHYYRTNKKHQSMSIHENNLINALEGSRLEGLKTLISEEIAETLVRSISNLDPRQRSILVLRCYEDMSYAEIASIMECSETTARVLFFRAKNNLKKRLCRKGITTLPMFLGLLGLFGRVTSPAKAAITVSASTLEVGGMGAVIGWGLSKIGAFLLLLMAGAVIVTGVVLTHTASPHPYGSGVGNEPKSYHFTKHAWKEAYIPTANLRVGRSLSKGAYEQWFFFPEGIEGPLYKMIQRWDPKVENKLCSWLLNEDGQHYYHSGENTIYLMNNPLAKLNTARFPSDSKEFCEFLDRVEGKEEGLEYVRDPKTGFLMEIIDRRFANAKDFVSGVDRNTFNETEFGNFRYKWPKDAGFVDERDAIHQQRWTLYEITGTVNGQTVYGKCRIPFVYGARQEFPPLLKLQVGNQYSVIDSPEGAFVLDANNKTIGSYPSGSFFKGLVRPWFGVHTIDLLRREAAKRRIPFKLENLEYDGYSYQNRILTLYQAPGYGNIEIAFYVDINKNEIQQVLFTDGNTSIGTLQLSYPASPESITGPIEMPSIKKRWFTDKEPVGILWLFELAQGTLAQK